MYGYGGEAALVKWSLAPIEDVGERAQWTELCDHPETRALQDQSPIKSLNR